MAVPAPHRSGRPARRSRTAHMRHHTDPHPGHARHHHNLLPLTHLHEVQPRINRLGTCYDLGTRRLRCPAVPCMDAMHCRHASNVLICATHVAHLMSCLHSSHTLGCHRHPAAAGLQSLLARLAAADHVGSRTKAAGDLDEKKPHIREC